MMYYLFYIGNLLRLEYLAWIIGLPLLLASVILLWYQYRIHKRLNDELAHLKKIHKYSIEYELVLKAMKLCIWRIDVPAQTIAIESDYRSYSDNLIPPQNSDLEVVLNQIDPRYYDEVRMGLRHLMEGKKDDFRMEYQVRVPHSDRTYWSESFATIDKRDLEGKPLSVVVASMRIDQEKEIESALMDALYHAEESDRLKSAFLANISHEIRTPLNAIVGFSGVMAMTDDPKERQGLADMVKQNNTHLLRLFEDIVNMSKLEARSGEAIKMLSFPLAPLFGEMLAKYADMSRESGVALIVVNENQLPTIKTDRTRLHELLNQYVMNAMKFTSEGHVDLGCDDLGRRWRIWVRDTGKGIPEDKCNEQLFERFVKIDEFVPGTGLGLSICRSLALSIGGEVGVSSKLGEGSTFWVDIDKD